VELDLPVYDFAGKAHGGLAAGRHHPHIKIDEQFPRTTAGPTHSFHRVHTPYPDVLKQGLSS
jgi:hypothetical protein